MTKAETILEKLALSFKLLDRAKNVAREKAVIEQLKPVRDEKLIAKRLSQVRLFGNAALNKKG